MNVKIRLLLFCTLIIAAACDDDEKPFDAYQQLSEDVTAIDSHLANTTDPVIKDVSGVRMVIKELGTGLPASLYGNSTMEVQYAGTLFSNGNQFDEGTITGNINSYIAGWRIAFSTLPAGSEATLYIPSGYGYGNAPQSTIPANSILVFDVHFKRLIPTTEQSSKFTSDTTAINTYLAGKNITADDTISGVRFKLTQAGSGTTATLYDKIHLKYTFRLLSDDTEEVDSFEKQPDEEFYSRVIDYLPGMGIGLQKMNEGSKATLYIPSGLAFGPNTIRNEANETVIVPNANLIVEIELIDIVQ